MYFFFIVKNKQIKNKSKNKTALYFKENWAEKKSPCQRWVTWKTPTTHRANVSWGYQAACRGEGTAGERVPCSCAAMFPFLARPRGLHQSRERGRGTPHSPNLLLPCQGPGSWCSTHVLLGSRQTKEKGLLFITTFLMSFSRLIKK